MVFGSGETTIGKRWAFSQVLSPNNFCVQHEIEQDNVAIRTQQKQLMIVNSHELQLASWVNVLPHLPHILKIQFVISALVPE